MTTPPPQAVRGMNDILPERCAAWQHVEQALRDLMRRYAYQEIRFPIVEQTRLFRRSVGAATDIVEKEMYTFADRNGDELCLRPEGTAGCVRAALAGGLLRGGCRLWYLGPMFRHERPQKGRYRQFHQFSVESFGLADADIDAEMLMMSAALWRELKLDEGLTLQLNSLGTPEERVSYRAALVDYLTPLVERLDEDSRRRLQHNPLRILDSKAEATQALLAQAPQMIDFLGEASRKHFETLCAMLDRAGVAYTVNPRLVRGLDYYCHTVFEWVTDKLGAQAAVCAGGRYDGLAAQLGGSDTPAVGFSVGLERLLDLWLASGRAIPHNNSRPDIYIIVAGESAAVEAPALAAAWRAAAPRLGFCMHCGGGSLKSQFKKADKSGAAMALILAEAELSRREVGIKYLREERPQQTVALAAMTNWLRHRNVTERVNGKDGEENGKSF